MTVYVALLRAVNVGGQKLLMSDLKAIGEQLKLESPRTFIASGNLLFRSAKAEPALKRELEAALGEHLGAPVDVMIRTAPELAQVLSANAFADEPGNKVVAIFLDEAPGGDVIASAKNVGAERLAPGKREIYVHYPDGQGRSKLKLSARAPGTARNMNTVAKLAGLAGEMS